MEENERSMHSAPKLTDLRDGSPVYYTIRGIICQEHLTLGIFSTLKDTTISALTFTDFISHYPMVSRAYAKTHIIFARSPFCFSSLQNVPEHPLSLVLLAAVSDI